MKLKNQIFGSGTTAAAQECYAHERDNVLRERTARNIDAYSYYSARMDAAYKFWMALVEIEETTPFKPIG